ncbi:TPA: hypothetical protein MAM49_000138 [Klebsiella pneumoniae]|nr:hypothetical protein [Klebsiella pneumoniae]
MKTLNRRDFPGAQYPDRIIQFGEGNFLRAFVDWQIDLLNEHTDLNAGIVVVRPIATDFPPSLNTQDGLYTTIIRGLNEQGEAVSDARLIRSAFYRGERDGESYPVQDDADWISRYQTLWARHRDGQMSTRELVTAVLSVADHWQQDLSQIPGLVELVTADLDAILTCGMRDAVKPLC